MHSFYISSYPACRLANCYWPCASHDFQQLPALTREDFEKECGRLEAYKLSLRLTLKRLQKSFINFFTGRNFQSYSSHFYGLQLSTSFQKSFNKAWGVVKM